MEERNDWNRQQDTCKWLFGGIIMQSPCQAWGMPQCIWCVELEVEVGNLFKGMWYPWITAINQVEWRFSSGGMWLAPVSKQGMLHADSYPSNSQHAGQS